jgi:hypothetical protein
VDSNTHWYVVGSKNDASLDFVNTIKWYAEILLSYRPIAFVHFLLHWSHGYGHCFRKIMYLLLDCSASPYDCCRKLHLRLHRSLFRRHDFYIVSTKCTFVLNNHVVGFAEYNQRLSTRLVFMPISRLLQWFVVRKTVAHRIGLQSNGTLPPAESPIPVSDSIHTSQLPMGGGYRHIRVLKFSYISPFIISPPVKHPQDQSVLFVDHLDIVTAREKYKDASMIFCDIPLDLLVPNLLQQNLRDIATQHGVFLNIHATKKKIKKLFEDHSHGCDHKYVTVFSLYSKKKRGNMAIDEKINIEQEGISLKSTIGSEGH